MPLPGREQTQRRGAGRPQDEGRKLIFQLLVIRLVGRGVDRLGIGDKTHTTHIVNPVTLLSPNQLRHRRKKDLGDVLVTLVHGGIGAESEAAKRDVDH